MFGCHFMSAGYLIVTATGNIHIPKYGSEITYGYKFYFIGQYTWCWIYWDWGFNKRQHFHINFHEWKLLSGSQLTKVKVLCHQMFNWNNSWNIFNLITMVCSSSLFQFILNEFLSRKITVFFIKYNWSFPWYPINNNQYFVPLNVYLERFPKCFWFGQVCQSFQFTINSM